MAPSLSNLLSGTFTMPTLGSTSLIQIIWHKDLQDAASILSSYQYEHFTCCCNLWIERFNHLSCKMESSLLELLLIQRVRWKAYFFLHSVTQLFQSEAFQERMLFAEADVPRSLPCNKLAYVVWTYFWSATGTRWQATEKTASKSQVLAATSSMGNLIMLWSRRGDEVPLTQSLFPIVLLLMLGFALNPITPSIAGLFYEETRTDTFSILRPRVLTEPAPHYLLVGSSGIKF